MIVLTFDIMVQLLNTIRVKEIKEFLLFLFILFLSQQDLIIWNEYLKKKNACNQTNFSISSRLEHKETSVIYRS